MKLIKFLTLAAVGFLSISTAGAENYIFKQYQAGENVPQSIHSISVQKQGYAWLCSGDGVVKMDNVNETLYKRDINDPNSLISNNVRQVVFDAEGSTWILTDAGISRFRPQTDDFENFDLAAEIAVSVGGVCYFAKGNNIHIFDYKTGSFVEKYSNIVSPQFKVDQMCEWINNRILLFSKNIGLILLDPETGESSKVPLSTASIDNVFVDSYFNLWCSRSSGGLLKFDRSFMSVSVPDISSRVTCFTEASGRMYFGTNEGIEIYTPFTNSFELLSHRQDSRFVLPANSVLSLAAISDNVLIAGRARGGFITMLISSIESFQITSPGKDYLCPDGLNAIEQFDGDERIWCLTDGSGFAAFNPANSTFSRYSQTSGYRPTSMARMADGRFLFYNSRDCFRTFDPSSGSVAAFSFSSPILDQNVFVNNHIVSQGPGNLVFITTNNAIYTYDTHIRELRAIYVPTEACGYSTIKPAKGSDGEFFNNDRFVFRYNPKDYSLVVLADIGEEADLESVAGYDRDVLWLATSRGLGMVDVRSGSLKMIDNEFVSDLSGVAVGSSGLVWMTNFKSVFSYDPQHQSFYRISISDGVTDDSGYTSENLLVASSGDVYFSGPFNLVRLPADFHARSLKKPELTVESLTVGSFYVESPQPVKIKSSGKQISLHLFAKSDNLREPKQYKVKFVSKKLENIVESASPTIPFIPGAPGRYAVYASCAMSDCQWTDWDEVMTFVVRPKWSESWWFYLGLFIVSFVVMLIIFSKMRKKDAGQNSPKEKITGVLSVSESDKTVPGIQMPAQHQTPPEPPIPPRPQPEPQPQPRPQPIPQPQAPIEPFVDDSDEDDAPELVTGLQNSLLPTKEEYISLIELKDASILVVEDDIELRRYLKEELSVDVKQVFEAGNGLEAIDVLNRQNIDIVVSDVMMPEMDGFALCRYIKTTVAISHIPVILLTARVDENSRIIGYKNGADEYLTKPFDVNFLKTTIGNMFLSRALVRRRYQENGMSPNAKDSTFSSADERFMTDFDNLIQKNIENPDLDISLLVDGMSMSRTVLFNKVKQLTGMNLQNYVNKCRMEYVIKLMITTDYSLAEIAEHSGFNSPRYFSTSFKNYTGKTPSQYKKDVTGKE